VLEIPGCSVVALPIVAISAYRGGGTEYPIRAEQ
jgi:hypothetical protein